MKLLFTERIKGLVSENSSAANVLRRDKLGTRHLEEWDQIYWNIFFSCDKTPVVLKVQNRKTLEQKRLPLKSNQFRTIKKRMTLKTICLYLCRCGN